MSLRRRVSEKFLVPLAVRATRPPVRFCHDELVRLDRADLDELRSIQWERLQSIVEHAQQDVPYYEESFSPNGVRAEQLRSWEDLLYVPTIDKRQIAANFPDRMTSRGSDPRTWEYIATSGTTDRLTVVRDAEARSHYQAQALYGQQVRGTYAPGSLRVEIPPDVCSLACAAAAYGSSAPAARARRAMALLAVLGRTGGLFRVGRGVFRAVAFPRREMPSFGPAGTRMPADMLAWYVRRIRRWQPAVVSGLPTYLQLVGRHIQQLHEVPPTIGSLLPEGALSTPALKKELTHAFGTPVHEVYGAHEFGNVGSTCEYPDKIHVMMSECLVETVRAGKHVAPGELGEIVVTAFANKTMPLIRYRPGDVGRLYENSCPCGRQTQLLTLQGRLQDMIVTSRGPRTAQEIIDFLAAWPNVEFAQLVQRSETRCDLLLVEQHRGRTNLHDVADAVADFLGEEMQVRPRLVSTIKPEASGKFRFVKSTSYERFHEAAPREWPLPVAVTARGQAPAESTKGGRDGAGTQHAPGAAMS